MRKVISSLLIFILVFSIVPFSVFANDTVSQYTDEEKELIYLKYMNHEYMLDALFGSDTALAYWTMVNDTEESGTSKWAINTASKIIGEYPDKQDYVEILANLIMLQSGNIAEQVQMQSQLDDLKDGVDYTMDIVDIATIFVGGNGLFEEISPIIDAATGGAEVIVENLEQAKYYEITIRDYSQSKMFLDAVSEYAANEELKSVAKSLLVSNDTLLEKRLDYLIASTETLADYEAEFFFENMSVALLKASEAYKSDETVKWYVDCGEKLSDSVESIFATGNFAFQMTMLAGDIGFGTSDTFNRYQEMKIVSEIAGAIVKASRQIMVPEGEVSDATLENIKTKCEYYKMLLTTHARGEYLIYQLLINDASLLSDFRVLFEHFKDPKDSTHSWYANQIDCLEEYYNILNNMFEIEKISDEAVDKEDNLSRINYYDSAGKLIYYESYAYYDNGLLCSTTLHSLDYFEDGTYYTEPQYTFLYLYDSEENLQETVFDALTIPEWYDEATGEVILDYIYGESENSTKLNIFPLQESIEQEKYQVDASKTEEIYGDTPIISTESESNWARVYLEHIFEGSALTDSTEGRFIYVDDDNVPELWMDYHYGYAGAEIFTVDDETTESIIFNHGTASWIENDNQLLLSGGHMGSYYDMLYKIEDGKFISVSDGAMVLSITTVFKLTRMENFYMNIIGMT